MDEPVRGAEGQSVLTKIADLIDYIEPFMDRMPRADKGHEGLGTKLRGCIYAMAERAMDTRKCRYAKSTLKELNELDKQIQYAKFYVARAYKKKIIDHKRFEEANDYLVQIGKMTGSWISVVSKSVDKESNGNRL